MPPQLADFMARHGFADYPSLHNWSVNPHGDFWNAFRRWAALPLPNQAFNFAEILLARGGGLIAADESGREEHWSIEDLRRRTASYQAWLREQGIGVGDRVAAYLPNRPETIALMLAATGLGAVWTSCSPDFGVAGVLDRLQQIEPKVLVSTARYRFHGKQYELGERHKSIQSGLPRLAAFALIEDLPQESSVPLEFVPLSHAAPLFILFSSGTTGLPKCIVHSAGGTLVQIVKEIRLHADVRAGEKLFYYTTCGWMMWNWLVTGLACGATLLLYDGSPFYPGPAILWDLAERLRLEHFGTSAKYLALLEKSGYPPGAHHDLSALRQILSTGSPLAPHSFDFVSASIKRDLHLASISGGTDIVSCFVLGNPLLPVHRGEIQCAGLGMDVQIWNENGERIFDEPGELVCVNRFPSQPLGFWNDPAGTRYRKAYFERFPGAWHHGDWARQSSSTLGFTIYGRSDTTLNPGGVRIGSAEIYRQVETIEEVIESVAVGQAWEGDVRIVLFVRLREGTVWSPELEEKIRQTIRQQASPHHVPKKILPVADLPRTVNGKLSEAAVRNAVNGQPIANEGALANPESLALFRGLPELSH